MLLYYIFNYKSFTIKYFEFIHYNIQFNINFIRK